jgi:hypothetical protein
MLIKFSVEFHSILSPSHHSVIPTFPKFKPPEPTDRTTVKAAVHSLPPNRDTAFL